MLKNKLGILLFSLILLIVSCGNKKDVNKNLGEDEGARSLTPVTTIAVENSDFFEYGEYYGRVKGVKSSEIINVLGGTVESVDVVEGSRVSVGDSLGKISSEKARLNLESAKLSAKINKDNYYTLKRFLKSGNASQIKVDQAHLQWLTSKAQVIDAQKAYDAAFNIAQINGIVVTRAINKEDEVRQGQQTFLIEDLTQIEIKIGIPEGDMEGIEVGNPAEVFLDLFPDRKWEGTLTRHSRRSSDDNLTFSATVIVDNKDGEILSGTTAKVRLLRKSFKDQVVIPNNTIINEDDGDYVMVLVDNTVNRKKVEIVASSIEESVISSGIQVGDVIVQEGLHLLIDSQKVKVVDQEV